MRVSTTSLAALALALLLVGTGSATAKLPVPLTDLYHPFSLPLAHGGLLAPLPATTGLELHRLRPGPGLRVRFPRRAYGTWIAVSRLQQLGLRYRQRFPTATPIWVHDMSKRGGGWLPLHFSHRDGRDADVRLPLRARGAGYVDATPRSLALRRTAFILLQLFSTCDVDFIMLDRELQGALRRHLRPWFSPGLLYALLSHPHGAPGAVVRHRAHHKNHFHVRFRTEGAPLQWPGARALCRPPLHQRLQQAMQRYLEGTSWR